jgi:hypothetical protein
MDQVGNAIELRCPSLKPTDANAMSMIPGWTCGTGQVWVVSLNLSTQQWVSRVDQVQVFDVDGMVRRDFLTDNAICRQINNNRRRALGAISEARMRQDLSEIIDQLHLEKLE